MSLEQERSLRAKLKSILKRDVGAAVFEFGGGGKVALTNRLFLEGVHFDLSYTTPLELGEKLVVICANSLATRGVRARQVGVTLALRQDTHEFFVSQFMRGVAAVSKRNGIDVLNVNFTSSPTVFAVGLFFSGRAASRSKMTRLKSGDLIAVTGSLGTSSAGLDCLKKIGRENLNNWEALTRAHLQPLDQTKSALKLRTTSGVKRILLLSEGLARDLNDACEEWGVGAGLDEQRLPVSDATHWAGRSLNYDPKRWVLYGGEDYQLLLVLDAKKAHAIAKKFKLTLIGEILHKKEGVKLLNPKGKSLPLLPRNWNDLVRRSAPVA